MPKAGTSKAAAAKKPAAKKKANGYQMPEKIPMGEVLTDISKQQWRIGPTIGAGGFGEIYSACPASSAKKSDDYAYVVKVVSERGPARRCAAQCGAAQAAAPADDADADADAPLAHRYTLIAIN